MWVLGPMQEHAGGGRTLGACVYKARFHKTKCAIQIEKLGIWPSESKSDRPGVPPHLCHPPPLAPSRCRRVGGFRRSVVMWRL